MMEVSYALDLYLKVIIIITFVNFTTFQKARQKKILNLVRKEWHMLLADM